MTLTRPFHRSFGGRIAVLFLGLLLVIQLSGFVAIRRSIDANARAALNSQVAVAERLMQRLLAQNTKVLSDGVSLLARDFGFIDAVKSGDGGTVASALDNQGARIGATFTALLNPQGELVAVGESNHSDYRPMLAALTRDEDGHLPDSQYALVAGKAFQFVVSPLKPPQINDLVVMGFPIDQALVDSVQNLSGVRMALVTQGVSEAPEVELSSMAGASSPALAELSAGTNEVSLQAAPGEAELVLARTVVLATTGQGQLRAVLYRSIDEAVAPYRRLQGLLALITGLGLGLFVLGSLWAARNVSRPVRHLVQAAQRLGQGDFVTPVRPERDDELGELALAFDDARLGLAAADKVSREDPLTGLPNRASFERTLRLHLDRGQPLALLTLNLDRLGRVNQLLGRSQGDRLLHCAAERIRAVVRCLPELPLGSGDLLARLGSDEFALLLPGCDGERATAIAEQVLAAFEKPVALEGSSVDLSAGIGIALFPEHADAPEALMARALLAMSEAKRRSAGVMVYQPSIDAGSAQTLSLLGELRQALRQHELRLFLQPKLQIRDGSLIGAEALVRWQHPERGLVPPVQFIPFAEETGFIHELTLWVVDEAARIWSAQAAQGFELRLSVNLSAHDLMKPDLLARLDARLRHHGTPPRALCLEITESAIALDPARALRTLHELKGHGFKLSIDDFGAGYTSLAQLIELPVDELKIDMFFVRTMDSNADKASMVGSLIQLAHDRKLSVVAEGIENLAILGQLEALGCDEGQGYHIGKPMPAGDLPDWVDQRWPGRAGVLVPGSAEQPT
jgi:diguanylate cyclase (GGDEF)-like protein